MYPQMSDTPDQPENQQTILFQHTRPVLDHPWWGVLLNAVLAVVMLACVRFMELKDSSEGVMIFLAFIFGVLAVVCAIFGFWHPQATLTVTFEAITLKGLQGTKHGYVNAIKRVKFIEDSESSEHYSYWMDIRFCRGPYRRIAIDGTFIRANEFALVRTIASLQRRFGFELKMCPSLESYAKHA